MRRNVIIVVAVISALILGIVVLASAAWGWWGFGIATAVAVAIAIVFSNRAPAPATGAGATPPAPKSSKQPDRWVQVFENIGGIVSLVVFGGLVFAAIGLAQECGSGVSAELARLHEVFPGKATAAAQQPTPPQPTPPIQPIEKSPTGAPIYPTGTVLHFVTNGECAKWRLRIMNAEWAEKEKTAGKELVQWFITTDKDLYWTLSRDGWAETTANGGKSCHVQAEISR